MISKEKEYETKVLISKTVFNQLLRNYNLRILDNKLIKNNYFDTNNFDVFNNNAVFRVREGRDKITITFKRAINRNELLEYNQNISDKRFENIKLNNFSKSKFKKILAENGILQENIGYLGSLITHRWEFKYKDAKIFIDHSVYNDMEDYEIECEASSSKQAEKIIIAFCKENNINFSVKSLAKYARFLKSRRGDI